MCAYHCEDEAIYWEDEYNNVFINSSGEMSVTIDGYKMQFQVEFCPMCGMKLSKSVE